MRESVEGLFRPGRFGRIGVEVELSPSPRPSVAAMLADLQPMLARAVALTAERGVAPATAGTDPGRREPPD